MPMAYITEPGAILRAEGNTILVTKDDEKLAEWKLIHLDGVVLVGRITLTTAAMEILLKESIPVALVSRRGDFLGRLEGARTIGLQTRLSQLRLYDNPQKRLLCAKRIVEKKIDSMANVIDSYASNYSEYDLPNSRDEILAMKKNIINADSPAYLRGVEGSAARKYWETFEVLNRSSLRFKGRSRRPPKDHVNALLSLGYTILVGELTWTIHSMGLDPMLGYYHEIRAGRPALSLDIIEPLRHAIIDRMVLKTINRNQLQKKHFEIKKEKAHYLTRDGMKIFLKCYEDALNTTIAKNFLVDGQKTETTSRKALRDAVSNLVENLKKINPKQEKPLEQAA